jgi:hypothetical protein
MVKHSYYSIWTVILLNGLTALSEEKLQKILIDSKRVGTSIDFIRMIEAAIQLKTSLKEKHRIFI